jgi:hypothetical protein
MAADGGVWLKDEILERLRRALRAAWSAETSAESGSWTAENPSWGQCAVTACLVQDVLGGEILWAAATTPDGARHSHYFNRLEDGIVLDLTCDQFPAGTEFAPRGGCAKTSGSDGSTFSTTRDYILSFPSTRYRYEQLRDKARRCLGR